MDKIEIENFVSACSMEELTQFEKAIQDRKTKQKKEAWLQFVQAWDRCIAEGINMRVRNDKLGLAPFSDIPGLFCNKY